MSEIVKVAELFCDALRKHGKMKIMKAIKQVQHDKISNNHDLIIDFIIEKVCSDYSIKPFDIKKENVLRDDLECREMCIVLISKYTDLKQMQIAKEFNLKTQKEITKAINNFKHKNPKIKQDALFLERYEKLKPSVDSFIESL